MSKILMVSAEADPFSRGGGLAEVLGRLPGALQSMGDSVAVLTPLYRAGAAAAAAKAPRVWHDLPVWLGERRHDVHIRLLTEKGVHYYFLEAPVFFDRPGIYGENHHDYPDNAQRFAALCQGALGVIRHLFRPEVLHLHDWPAAMAAPLMRWQAEGDPTFYGIRVLLTIHNPGFQGLFGWDALRQAGLRDSLFHPDRLEFYGQGNLLKGGIQFADAITTISPSHARAIATPEGGMGLDGVLRQQAARLSGIVNGIDAAVWNPETDPYLRVNYATADLSGKVECKRELLAVAGFGESPARALAAIGPPLTGEKGLDLLEVVSGALAERDDFSILLLGGGDPHYEWFAQDWAGRYPDRVAWRGIVDETLLHKAMAGADLWLMPSRYEAGGWQHLAAMRYGTAPVARAAGGPDDTIDEDTGYKFGEYTPDAFRAAVTKALEDWVDSEGWRKRVLACMSRDYSWRRTAAEYSELYRRLKASPVRQA